MNKCKRNSSIAIGRSKRVVKFGLKWVRLALNGTNPGIFSDQIQYILAQRQSVLSLISK